MWPDQSIRPVLGKGQAADKCIGPFAVTLQQPGLTAQIIEHTNLSGLEIQITY